MPDFIQTTTGDENPAQLEAEERLAALTDQGARFVELVAAGHPVEEAFARAGYTEGSAIAHAMRPDILAAVGTLRERNLGANRTDAAYLRRVALGVAAAAHRDGDQRVVLTAVRLLAEMDGHLVKETIAAPPAAVNVQINFRGDSPPVVDLAEVLR